MKLFVDTLKERIGWPDTGRFIAFRKNKCKMNMYSPITIQTFECNIAVASLICY